MNQLFDINNAVRNFDILELKEIFKSFTSSDFEKLNKLLLSADISRIEEIFINYDCYNDLLELNKLGLKSNEAIDRATTAAYFNKHSILSEILKTNPELKSYYEILCRADRRGIEIFFHDNSEVTNRISELIDIGVNYYNADLVDYCLDLATDEDLDENFDGLINWALNEGRDSLIDRILPLMGDRLNKYMVRLYKIMPEKIFNLLDNINNYEVQPLLVLLRSLRIKGGQDFVVYHKNDNGFSIESCEHSTKRNKLLIDRIANIGLAMNEAQIISEVLIRIDDNFAEKLVDKLSKDLAERVLVCLNGSGGEFIRKRLIDKSVEDILQNKNNLVKNLKI